MSDNAARFGFATSLPALIDLTAIAGALLGRKHAATSYSLRFKACSTMQAPYYLALCGSSVADRYDGELRRPADWCELVFSLRFVLHSSEPKGCCEYSDCLDLSAHVAWMKPRRAVLHVGT